MTYEKDSTEDSFIGLMRHLNLDDAKFKSYDNTSFERLSYDELSDAKYNIEEQLDTLSHMLFQEYRADMETSLVTEDGFPRNDIDVVAVRLIRIKIIRLRNDLRSVYVNLEKSLVERFNGNKAQGAMQESEVSSQSPRMYTIAFALVGEVVENGPAHMSGLKEGDRIISIDNVHAGNHRNLAGVLQKVQSNKEKELTVQLFRDNSRMTLTLVPTDNWEGNGLLGCRLIPL